MNCTSKARCGNGQYGMKHNTLLHRAWSKKDAKLALTTSTPRSVLLTTKVYIHSVRKWEGAIPINVVADNGATFSILDKKVADAKSLTGVTKPILMKTFGKDKPITMVEGSVFLYTARGKLNGKTTVNIVDEFVEIEAHDWSKAGRKFEKFRRIPFEEPLQPQVCSLLLGNNKPEYIILLSAAMVADEADTYVIETKVGWMAAGMTHKIDEDVRKVDVPAVVQQQREDMETKLRSMQ
jgi:hypothetical protein